MNTKVNHFNPYEHFFIVDSNELNATKTHLYGFAIEEDGIYENTSLNDNDKKFEGSGIYTFVSVDNEQIIITQDFYGSYGLYLFKENERFVLSNSFYYLFEYLKNDHNLTINRDYVNHMFVSELCAMSPTETAINEISMLDKDIVVIINKDKKDLSFIKKDYNEQEFLLDSFEGIKILDYWYQKWVSIIKNIYQKTRFFSVELSGGFDSRIVMSLFLNSGIKMSDVHVKSYQGNTHTFSEDYEIASMIADRFNFTLNENVKSNDYLQYSLADTINICLYNKLFFHKEMNMVVSKLKNKQYVFTGSGGETIRAYWQMDEKELIEYIAKRCKRYRQAIKREVKISIKKLVRRGINHISHDKKITNIGQEYYNYTRCRNHFGKGSLEKYFQNTFELSPLLDPLLKKLIVKYGSCNDEDLLMALIFKRYCPELLEFKFQGGRSIDVETLKLAESINNKYPFIKTERDIKEFAIKEVDDTVIDLSDKKEKLDYQYPNEYLKKVFDSRVFEKQFSKYFDDDIYSQANLFYNQANRYKLRDIYPIIATTLLINDTERKPKSDEAFDVLDNFIDETLYNPYLQSDEYVCLPKTIYERLKKRMSARLDICLIGDNTDFNVSCKQKDNTFIREPEYLQKEGKGYLVESVDFSLDLDLEIKTQGTLSLSLKGLDVKNENNERIEMWIEYNCLSVNNEVIFNENENAWHNKPYKYEKNVEAGDIITIHTEWKPGIE